MMLNLPDRYTDVQELAPGKNAEVFRAKHQLLGSDVFLKTYEFDPTTDEFGLQEPQLLRELDSVYVTRIHDAEVIGEGKLLLAMEMLEGGSFQDQINAANKAQVWSSLHLILDAARDAAFGLRYLHEHGYVHRDVKPANLMFRRSPAGTKGVVTDLGLVGRLNETGRAVRSRHARAYRPLEAWTTAGYSPSSDLYQLGLVIYQLLGGELVYPAEELNDENLRLYVERQDGVNFSSLSPVIPPQLIVLLKKCICAEPSRIKTMPELLVELANLRNTLPDWSWAIEGSTYKASVGRGTDYFSYEIRTDVSPPITAGTRKSKSGKNHNVKIEKSLPKKNWQVSRNFRKWLNQ